MSTLQPLADGTATDDAAPRRVVVLGGGIAGLSAAWRLQQEAAKRALPLAISVLEASNRWGGKVRSEVIADWGEPPIVLEEGPDAILTRKPWAMAMARELGLTKQFVYINRANARTFVLRHGKLTPLPSGLQLLVPTRFGPFLQSPLFTPLGKARMLLDLVLPRRDATNDESLAHFVRRRLGAEALDRLGEPLLAGVFNGEADRQSIEATFPQFVAMEREHRSLILGARAAARKRSLQAGAKPAPPAFFSFARGAQVLIDGLKARLDADLRLETRATTLARTASGFAVGLTSGEVLRADAVLLATPTAISADLVRGIAPAASANLSAMRTSSIGSMHLAYRAADVQHPLKGMGVVIPSSEGRRIDGMTWSTSKWEGRAPKGIVLLRVFFGGPHTRGTLHLNDDRLVRLVRDELASILDLRAEPILTRTYRWLDGYPHYDVGHSDRVAALEKALPEDVALAGGAYHGVGVPDCVHSGQLAADRLLAFFERGRENAAGRGNQDT